MDSAQECEDDTIKDQMESGYVATRPRFTRARRSWDVNYRYLTIEDVRALQHFRDDIVQRGALPFYMPSLVKNGSFEIPALPGTGDLVDRWQVRPVNGGAVSLTSTAFDGNTAVQFASTAGQDVSHSNASIGGVQYQRRGLMGNPGDTLGFSFRYSVPATSQRLFFEARITLYLDDGTEAAVATSIAIGGAVTAGWQQAFATLAVPIPPNGQNIITTEVAITAAIAGFATKQALAAGEVAVLLDAVGVALTATVQKQAYMPGSSGIPVQVRFAKLPKFADMGWAGGCKRFGATFTVQEV